MPGGEHAACAVRRLFDTNAWRVQVSGDKRACTRPVDPTQLLSKFAWVGILEHFDISVCLFFFTIGDEGNFVSFAIDAPCFQTNRAPKPGGDPFRPCSVRQL